MTIIKNFLLVVLLSLSAIGLVHADPVLETPDTVKLQKSCGAPVDIKTNEGRFIFPFQQISVVKVFKGNLTGTIHIVIRVGDGITTTISVPPATNISKMVDQLC